MSPRALVLALVVSILIGTTFNCIAGTQKRELEMLQYRMPVEVTADVTWIECGDWNGYYTWADDLIEMCEENLELLSPGASRFVFLHELGHAYAHEHNMDYDRWGGSVEDEADEFATVMTLAQGRPEDLLEAALMWEKFNRQTGGPILGDTHSPALLRAKRLRQAYWGYKALFSDYYFAFKESVEFWRIQFLKDLAGEG